MCTRPDSLQENLTEPRKEDEYIALFNICAVRYMLGVCIESKLHHLPHKTHIVTLNSNRDGSVTSDINKTLLLVVPYFGYLANMPAVHLNTRWPYKNTI